MHARWVSGGKDARLQAATEMAAAASVNQAQIPPPGSTPVTLTPLNFGSLSLSADTPAVYHVVLAMLRDIDHSGWHQYN
jgi:hypothetical protein